MTVFEALASDNRRRMVTLLSQHDGMTATQISKKFKISAPAVSQHLNILREARLVTMVKDGQKHIYRLDLNGIQEVDHWLKGIKREWEERLDNLNEYVKALKKEGEKKHERSKK